MFKLQSYGSASYDCTIRYIVHLDKPYTVRTFIETILNECKGEWGFIETIDGREMNVCREYKDGKLAREMEESVLDKEVIEVKASGGYTRMDYIIKINNDDTNNDDTNNDDTNNGDNYTRIDYANEIKRSFFELAVLLKNCCKEIIEKEKRQ